jgi:nucleoside-diphosphate-sugar epimerase
MRVLIIGGTRYFGKLIVKNFLERGDTVSVLSRGNSRPDFWDHIEHIEADRSDATQMSEVLTDWEFDLVIDNIAFDKSDVKIAVETLRGKIGKYVVTSSVSTYGGIGHSATPWQPVTSQNRHLHYFVAPDAPVPLQEDSIDLSNVAWQVDPDRNPYADHKRQIERFLSETTDFPFTVLRAPIVIGPEEYAGRFWWYLQRILDGQGIVLRNGGTTEIRLGFTEDIATAFVDAALSNNTTGNTYNIAQNEIVTLRKFAEIIGGVVGVETRITALQPDESTMVGSIPWNDWRYEPFAWPENIPMAIERAKADFGLKNAPMEQRIRETIEWHKSADLGDSFGYEFRSAETKLFSEIAD